MMKGLLILAITAALLAGCASVSDKTGGAALSPADLSGVHAVVLTVHGLSCPLCSNNLDGQLRNVEGVEGADIDLKTGAVTVRLAASHAVTQADLAKAVEDAGFTLKGVRPVEDKP